MILDRFYQGFLFWASFKEGFSSALVAYLISYRCVRIRTFERQFVSPIVFIIISQFFP